MRLQVPFKDADDKLIGIKAILSLSLSVRSPLPQKSSFLSICPPKVNTGRANCPTLWRSLCLYQWKSDGGLASLCSQSLDNSDLPSFQWSWPIHSAAMAVWVSNVINGFRYSNTWFPVDDALWGGIVTWNITLLPEMYLWKWGFEIT